MLQRERERERENRRKLVRENEEEDGRKSRSRIREEKFNEGKRELKGRRERGRTWQIERIREKKVKMKE